MEAALTSHVQSRYDIVVMASSKGGIQALSCILSGLPADFRAPILVVLHRGIALPNYQAHVLSRASPLPVRIARGGERIQCSTVYLAPPHLHLVVRADHHLALRDGRRIRSLRSAADPLFETAAEVFGSRVLAVVLTGGDSDGTDGAMAVKRRGGTVFAQDAATSEDFSMPHSAIQSGCVDQVLPVQEIGTALVRAVMGVSVLPQEDSNRAKSAN